MTLTIPHGIYLHLPVCKRRCAYCDFYSRADSAGLSGAIAAGLRLEIEQREVVAGRTLYLGGGTPNLLTKEELSGLVLFARRHYNLSENAEVSIEANPSANHSEDYFTALRQAGVNRLSVGFQSFIPTELKLLGRLHGAEATGIFTNARRAGIGSISIDLLYDLPDQRPEHLRWSLEQALRLNVDHISLYALKLESGTPLQIEVAAGQISVPDSDAAADCYLLALELLEREGYAQYEISNFARPEHTCRHNEVYWRGEPFLGLGPSSVGDDGTTRRRNLPDLDSWLDALKVGEDCPHDDEVPTLTQRMAEQVMLALRTRRGISEEDFASRWGLPLFEQFPDLVVHLKAGRLQRAGERLLIAREHQLISDRILADLF